MLKYTKTKYNLGIYLPILFCVFICLFFRSDYTNANILLHKVFVSDYSLSNSYKLNNFVIYNLPEAMWVFSLTLLTLNYKLKLRKLTLSLVYLPLIYAWIAEFFQLANITNGTFDLLDVLFASATWFTAFILLKINENKLINSKSSKNIIVFIILFCSVFLADTSYI